MYKCLLMWKKLSNMIMCRSFFFLGKPRHNSYIYFTRPQALSLLTQVLRGIFVLRFLCNQYLIIHYFYKNEVIIFLIFPCLNVFFNCLFTDMGGIQNHNCWRITTRPRDIWKQSWESSLVPCKNIAKKDLKACYLFYYAKKKKNSMNKY